MSIADHHIRVFISSTFRDMQAERDYLVKFVFPRLRDFCESHGVIWGEVDLRWGIPDEEQAEARVLPICLEEVSRCRPYFVGLLGERYGASPKMIAPEVIAREPWLRGHATGKKSVTELEIIHGVFNNAGKPSHAFLYFRDPGYLDCLPPDANRADFESETFEAKSKLSELKQRIRHASTDGICQLRENYRDPEQLGKWLEADLTALIDQLFPREVVHDAVSAAHARFASERRRFWVGREMELRDLNAIAVNSRAALVVGVAGTGRSAFLANWTAAWRETHPEALIVEHYVGAHPDASSLNGCCRQLCLALAKGSGQPPPEAAAGEEWINVLDEQLATAALVKPVLLVVDGADRLHGRDSFFPEWLPEELPEGVQIIASADKRAELLGVERKWPVLHLGGLSPNDRATLITQYLAPFGKTLLRDGLRQIAFAPATANPFYLTLLLEELRQHGDNSTLVDRITELLTAPDIFELCKIIFSRCERDYGDDVTAGALGLLATTRVGLSDIELRELLGGPKGRLPQRRWSALQLALRRVLVSREGMIAFAQSETLDAARRRYCLTHQRRRALHRQLADYFLARPESPRAAVEVLFHLHRLKQWNELADWLSRAGAFATVWRIAPDSVVSAWSKVEKNSRRRAADACAGFSAAFRPAALAVLRRLGHWFDALALARQAQQEAKSLSDDRQRIETSLTVGAIELEAGAPREAEAAFVEAEEIATALGDAGSALRALRGQAQSITRQSMSAISNVWSRVQLGRQLQAVRDRANRITSTKGDQSLEAEELVVWLEEFVGQGGTLDMLVGIAEVVRVAFGPSSRGRFEEKMQRAINIREARLTQLDEIVSRLRHTRHRGLALRAAVALAKVREDRDQLWLASILLRQYAQARQDYRLMAEASRDCAEACDRDDKLFFLQEEGDYLECATQHPALVRNWWNRAELLWPELNRRSEALEFTHRVNRELRSLPAWSDRMLFRFYRTRLLLRLDDQRLMRLARVGLWIVWPFWVWTGWQLCGWVSTWFSRHPIIGLITYALAFPIFVMPAIMLLGEGLDLLQWLYRRVSPSNNKNENIGANTISTCESQSGTNRLAPSEADLISNQGKASVEIQNPVSQSPLPERLFEIPRFISKVIQFYTRMARIVIRTQRVGYRLRWDRLGIQVTWSVLAGLIGLTLTMFYWRQRDWGPGWFIPVGLVGQLLILEALGGLLLFGVIRRFGRRFSFLPARTGSPLSFACLLGLVRVKRLVFGRRRSKP